MRPVIPVLVAILGAAAHAAPAWKTDLCLAGGGQWDKRVSIVATNSADQPVKGAPVSVAIGNGAGEAPLVGVEARELRVCNEAGIEMLFGVTDPAGRAVTAGPIPARSHLTIPIECEANASATYYVYFDNPSAWQMPDAFAAAAGVRNGDLEEGEGLAPDGWHHDGNDAHHRTSWVTEDPQSGSKCLKTEVDPGAEETWIATRQDSLSFTGGARYVMRAWVKARDVIGFAGWYIHVGNEKNYMLISPMLSGGGGTYDWKEVTAEFTAPADANRGDLGTVLRGTGTAWFDNLSLECLDPSPLTAQAGPVEGMDLAFVGADAPWFPGAAQCAYRVPVRVVNAGDAPLATALTAVDLSGVSARLRGRARLDQLQVCVGGQTVPHYMLRDVLLFEGGTVPPRTVQTYYVYLPVADHGIVPAASTEAETTGGVNPALPGAQAQRLKVGAGPGYEALMNSPRNLVRNPSFEAGVNLPDDWPGGAEGEKPAGTEMGLVSPGLFGQRCARMHVPATSTPAWTGWRQNVPVLPGHTYLYAAWLKCQGLSGGLQLYAHYRNAEGGYCKSMENTGAGPAISSDTDWTMISGTFTMPEDIAHFQLHLTMNATGTAWHDGALLVEVADATAGTLQPRAASAPSELTLWTVNPLVKVFQDDVPPERIEPARISLGRNDYEPLQLCIRGGQDLRGVKVVVDAPTSAAGGNLQDIEVGVVGYVPIDAKTNYYSNRTPAYYRKLPTGAGSSDGWPGMWPDPLLPRDTLDLKAGLTQPVWITVYAPKGTAAGEYRGVVRLVQEGRTLARAPFTARVWDFDLPEVNHTAAIYDLRMDGRWDIPGKTHDEAVRDFLRFMARRRVCPDTIPAAPDIRYENGKVIADFTEFDKMASFYLDELNLPHFYTPWYFYLFGWGFPPSEKFGEKPYEGEYPYPGVDRSILRPEFKQAYQACLKVYWDHLKEKGWADRCVLYISDEPFYSMPEIKDQMKALCAMIHEVDPGIFIFCSTWAHIPDWDGYLNCWGIGHYGIVDPKVMAERIAAGDHIRWTTDGQMCTDTPYCGVERLLPHYCMKYGAEAYEFWGVNWLTYDPYQYGWHSFIFQSDTPENSYYVRYPNGDGFLAYPGAPIGHDGPVTSVRLEQAREGVEDYEIMYLMLERLETARAAGKDVREADAALAEMRALVSIPNAGGRFSSRIMPDPDAVLRARERVCRAAEALGK